MVETRDLNGVFQRFLYGLRMQGSLSSMMAATFGEDDSTPPTRQPLNPREGGSVGPEDPSKLPPIPPTEEPDHGIVEVPSVGPGLPPFTPEFPSNA